MGHRADLVYRRTQLGTVTIVAVGAAVVLLAVPAVAMTRFHPVTVAMLAVLVVALGMFCCLTIEIDHRQLRCFFGPGLIRRTFPLHEIVSARRVRNRWYYGWGIRLTPTGWTREVEKMMRWGATVSDAEKAALVAFLAARYPSR